MYRPKIAVASGWRWEPSFMVDDWKINTSWCDFHVLIDDRARPAEDKWVDEAWLYSQMREQAKELGAQWIMHISLDERLDHCAETVIRERIAYKKRTVLRLPVKELYTPTAYRNDKGFWQHEESRIYPLLDDFKYSDAPFHNPIAPLKDRFLLRESIPVNIYHQKHIEPSNRQARVDIYNEVDPGAEYSVLKNYEYLADEKGLQLKELSDKEGYDPPYRPFIFKTEVQE